ncbi:MAG: polyribonucleotide nucleotidyltransferase [Micavibrio sp.]|nr:polyribonucleotide nucleotidyltransferase [Micavibrio sp.]
MFNVFRKDIDFAGKTVTLETGKIARQADGAVLATMGGTSVLCTVVAAKSVKPGQDFFPLSVHYIEKFYASGRIPGGYLKREGRPSDNETLTSRLIDRPIRPLFPENFLNEVQVVCTVVSHDLVHPSDVLAMIGTSAALTLSGIPFMGPLGCARVAYVDGDYVINPTADEMSMSDLDLMVAGTTEGVLMVESEAQELSEEVMLGAVMTGWKAFQDVIKGIIELAEMAAKEPWDLIEQDPSVTKLADDLKKTFKADIEKAYKVQVKQERQAALSALKDKAVEQFASEDEGSLLTKETVLAKFKKAEADVVRGQVIDTKKRIDGRTTSDIRKIVCEVGVLPEVHGSALFTRGETQALVVTTLGTGQDEQMIDSLYGTAHERFMLHYNFPPYSVGEAGRMGGVGRREIGHGKLAWRAINPLLPRGDDFPYTLRVVSEITESNGSSSMATVCGTSMALMNAGIDLPKPVAGIAMGLIKEDDKFAVLSDILGDEDHLGDMDFKVAGTQDGITALQMDIKITSITEEIMQIALKQAKDGRIHILGEMAKAITQKGDLAASAPRVETMKIATDKIREVIGTGGKVIREICETTGAKLDINDEGVVKIYGPDAETIAAAKKKVVDIVAVPEPGTIYHGKVVKIMEFGAFVNFLGKSDGLVHISEIKNERVENVSDEVEEGQMVYVKLLGIDDRGKCKLSMKVVDQETGEELNKDSDEEAA